MYNVIISNGFEALCTMSVILSNMVKFYMAQAIIIIAYVL